MQTRIRCLIRQRAEGESELSGWLVNCLAFKTRVSIHSAIDQCHLYSSRREDSTLSPSFRRIHLDETLTRIGR